MESIASIASSSILRSAFGESYTQDPDWGGVSTWDRNGRGIWVSASTRWVSDKDSNKVVGCLTIVYDNLSSAIVDDQYSTLVDWVDGDWDVLDDRKVRGVEMIGDSLKVLLVDLGEKRRTAGGQVLTSLDAVMFRRGSVGVLIAGFNVHGLNPVLAQSRKADRVVNLARMVDAQITPGILAGIGARDHRGAIGIERGLPRVGDPAALSGGFIDLAPKR